MSEELEELESHLSDHFGRTPLNTPFNSQVEDDNISDIDAETDDELREDVFESRVRDYLHQSAGTSNVDNDDSFIDAVDCDGDHDGRDDDRADEDENDDEQFNEADPDCDMIRQFKTSTCCKLCCHAKFSQDQIFTYLLNIKEMEKDTKDMYIMGLINDDSSTETTQRGKKRQRRHRRYTFLGTIVCKKTFLLCHDIGKKSLNSLCKHIDTVGITPRRHGNLGRKPHNAIFFEDVQSVVRFIRNCADERGIPQPAAPRGRDDIPPVYLPSYTTKVQLHKEYMTSCTDLDPSVRHVSISVFKTLWSTCVPHIKIATPRDDVCATCERMRRGISNAVSEEEKLVALDSMSQHILTAQKERDIYNSRVKRSSQEEAFPHFTFDFSQNVSLPHYSRQMGPLYFLSLRKIQIFGFRIDGLPSQLNFLIDENETMGEDGSSAHGPNSVISMVDWALGEHGNRAAQFSIHADNCPGQNKNKYVLGYIMWRVMTGQNDAIEYLMQIPGHARCLVDSGFAHIKKSYRRTDVETLGQLEAVVNRSSTTNIAVRYPNWRWRDWKAFIDLTFKAVNGIRKYQYFRFSVAAPGIVTVRQSSEDVLEEQINILKDPEFRFQTDARPEAVPEGGLSERRRDYLRKSVRPYISPANQNEFFGHTN